MPIMFRHVILCVGIFMTVRAEFTPDEKQTMYLEVRSLTDKCLKEFDMTFEEMLKKKQNGELDPCFLACGLKASKVLNDKGMFDPDEAAKLTAKLARNDETTKRFTEFGEICVAVNEKEVSDGEKGCERAKLLLDCFKEVISSHSGA